MRSITFDNPLYSRRAYGVPAEDAAATGDAIPQQGHNEGHEADHRGHMQVHLHGNEEDIHMEPHAENIQGEGQARGARNSNDEGYRDRRNTFQVDIGEVYKDDMAALGFGYLGDGVMCCYHCGFRFNLRDTTINPIVDHGLHSPVCSILCDRLMNDGHTDIINAIQVQVARNILLVYNIQFALSVLLCLLLWVLLMLHQAQRMRVIDDTQVAQRSSTDNQPDCQNEDDD